MNIGKIDFKNEFSAVKSKIKRKASGGKRQNKKEKQPRPKYPSAAKDSRRSVVFHVPVALQTVVAVLICCGVLMAAGFAVFTVEQNEISSLKKDLKAYADDGVVPAGSMDASVSLNIEAVAGRVSSLQKIIDGASDGTLSNDELQWISTELDEITLESQILNDVLNDTEADKTLKTTYKDAVQSPLVTLQESFDALKVQDADVVDTAVEGGAATDTGAFKSSPGMETGTKWGIAIAAAVLLILILFGFLFRYKIAAFFSRSKKTGKASAGKKKNTKNSRGSASRPGGKKPVSYPSNVKPAEKEHKTIPAEKPKAAATDESTPLEETSGTELDENDAFLEELAPALRKLAEKERKKAEDGTGMIEPSEEDLITFDDSVVTQDAIEEEEDSLFTKHGESPEKGKEDQ